jgi:hypothetical protein
MQKYSGGFLEPEEVKTFEIVFNKEFGTEVFLMDLFREFRFAEDSIPNRLIDLFIFEAVELLSVYGIGSTKLSYSFVFNGVRNS